ncbi:MAG: hypothetical protein HYV18_04810 [Gammaproteobacteria bacterium]|nr:hypothetical protein [Gammaproteobacteria bacterium]
MNKRLLVCTLIATVPALAQAAEGRFNAVDVFFSGGTIEPTPGSGELGGRGAGARIRIGATPYVFATLQSEKVPTELKFGDGSKQELDASETRGGVGARWILDPKLSAFMRGEIASLKTEFRATSGATTTAKESGMGGHAGVEFRALPFLGIYGEGGYLTAGDLSGFEFTVGLESVESTVGSFLEYRYSNLDDSDGGGIEYSLTRGGIRIRFE